VLSLRGGKKHRLRDQARQKIIIKAEKLRHQPASPRASKQYLQTFLINKSKPKGVKP
jgi:hypothetical protein